MSRKEKIYINLMSLLLLVSLISFALDEQVAYWIDWFVWGVFVVDTLYRLVHSERKWVYIKQHFFDFLAIIPFYQAFRFFKLFALVLLLIRTTSLGRRYLLPTYTHLKQSQFGRILISFVIVFILLPIPMVWLEPKMHHYGEVLWWAIQTATTVGYGDIVPVTFLGRILASILMIVGIGLISTVTSMITHYTLQPKSKKESIVKQEIPILYKIDSTLKMEIHHPKSVKLVNKEKGEKTK